MVSDAVLNLIGKDMIEFRAREGWLKTTPKAIKELMKTITWQHS